MMWVWGYLGGVVASLMLFASIHSYVGLRFTEEDVLCMIGAALIWFVSIPVLLGLCMGRWLKRVW